VKVKLSSLAEQDLIDGYRFYEGQQAGLGDYFLDSLAADIDSLVIYGGIHRRVFDTHRLLARTFPFAIYYDVIGEEVRVWAVADCRRSPSWVRIRVGQAKRGR
jgi:plasmid stabilization system protein ParE